MELLQYIASELRKPTTHAGIAITLTIANMSMLHPCMPWHAAAAISAFLAVYLPEVTHHG